MCTRVSVIGAGILHPQLALHILIELALNVANAHADIGAVGSGGNLIEGLARIARGISVGDVGRDQRQAGLVGLQTRERGRERLRQTHVPIPITRDPRSCRTLARRYRMTFSRSCDIWFAVVMTFVFAE